MKTSRIYIVSVLGVLSLAFLWGCFGGAGISEEELGLRKSSIYSESKTLVAPYEYNTEVAGSSQLIERSFENAPPMISHDVTDMLPITKDNNTCLACHLPENAAMTMAVAVPKTHLTDLRRNKDLKGQLDEARFNCSACHVPQAKLSPLVGNSFQPNFRNIDGSKKSNLIQILNEGVK
ncbi:nitrate reductase [Helicobacter monodelphidis]|uniref:nitrate reductase cytochrome c-type subunit n=1 Tax=Helicobacter sp. 15-1451 TaxID=2004995 RepID=UPI000DCD1E3A|nr:nitrate reductase cytochrome c-type subunit [Helicobacter sp. 15-1451]RAX58338.1 nitrate reductase [Helicobacter sp. 15-1451]